MSAPHRDVLGFILSDQAVAAMVGLAVVVVMRLLDWLFPKGYGFKKMIRDWSVPLEKDEDDRPLRNPQTRQETHDRLDAEAENAAYDEAHEEDDDD